AWSRQPRTRRCESLEPTTWPQAKRGSHGSEPVLRTPAQPAADWTCSRPAWKAVAYPLSLAAVRDSNKKSQWESAFLDAKMKLMYKCSSLPEFLADSAGLRAADRHDACSAPIDEYNDQNCRDIWICCHHQIPNFSKVTFGLLSLAARANSYLMATAIPVAAAARRFRGGLRLRLSQAYRRTLRNLVSWPSTPTLLADRQQHQHNINNNNDKNDNKTTKVNNNITNNEQQHHQQQQQQQQQHPLGFTPSLLLSLLGNQQALSGAASLSAGGGNARSSCAAKSARRIASPLLARGGMCSSPALCAQLCPLALSAARRRAQASLQNGRQPGHCRAPEKTPSSRATTPSRPTSSSCRRRRCRPFEWRLLRKRDSSSRKEAQAECEENADDSNNTASSSTSASSDEDGAETATMETAATASRQQQQQQQQQQRLSDPYKSTMWLGCEDGWLLVYYGTDNNNQAEAEGRQRAGITSLIHLDGRVYVSLASGEVVVYRRRTDGLWDFDKLHVTMTVKEGKPIKRMIAAAGKIWCCAGKDMIIVSPVSESVDSSFPINQQQQQQQQQQSRRSVQSMTCSALPYGHSGSVRFLTAVERPPSTRNAGTGVPFSPVGFSSSSSSATIGSSSSTAGHHRTLQTPAQAARRDFTVTRGNAGLPDDDSACSQAEIESESDATQRAAACCSDDEVPQLHSPTSGGVGNSGLASTSSTVSSSRTSVHFCSRTGVVTRLLDRPSRDFRSANSFAASRFEAAAVPACPGAIASLFRVELLTGKAAEDVVVCSCGACFGLVSPGNSGAYWLWQKDGAVGVWDGGVSAIDPRSPVPFDPIDKSLLTTCSLEGRPTSAKPITVELLGSPGPLLLPLTPGYSRTSQLAS
uniref:RIC1 domain-containing protein n=1 Tax=Macrostomum lignano TaxID=282301 RepID=A0A1I8F4F0_9PLAT